MPLAHPRIKTLGEFIEICDFFFINHLPYTQDLLCPKPLMPIQVCYLIQAMLMSLEEKEDWSGASIEETSHEVAKVFGINHKKILMPLLFATIMGKKNGPPCFMSAEILGKERTRARFLQAIEFLGGLSSNKMDELKKGWIAKNASHLIQLTQGDSSSS
jgi:glutamyl-tRNA synthetase